MDYVQIKLVTGENIIGILVDTNNETLDLACPMLVKYHTVLVPPSKTVEHLTASPYMRLTDDLFFRFMGEHVVAMRPLNTQGINIFINLLDEHHDAYQLQEAGVYDFVQDKLDEISELKRKVESIDQEDSMNIIRRLIEAHRSEKEEAQPEVIPEDLSKDRIIH
jgi:hypothetical protein